MTKAEFLDKLKNQIREYSSEETDKSLEYYSEMIDDRVEDGMTEGEAVASLGSVEEIAEQIKCELPLTTLVKYKAMEKTKGEKIPAWVIILIVLGSPLWFPILISIAFVIFSIYISIWSIAIAFWVCDLAFGVSSIACLIAAIVMLIKGSFVSVIMYIGLAFLLAALAIFFFFASFYISKGIIVGTIWIFKQLKKAIIKKEA